MTHPPLFPAESPPLPQIQRKIRDLAPEICLVLIIPAAFATGLLWLTLQLPLPGCAFHAVTDWPCLTCGMSRGAKELLAGEILAALRRNPLTILLPLSALATWVYALLTLTSRINPIRPQTWSVLHQRRLRLAILLTASLIWAYLILRKLLHT